MSIIAFAVGVWLCQQLPELPGLALLLAGSGGVLAVALVPPGCVTGRGCFRAAMACLRGVVACRSSRFRGEGSSADYPFARLRWRRSAVLLLALAVGFLWALGRAHWRLADELPMTSERRDVVVTGVVEELPQRLERGVRFVLRVEKASAPVADRVLLSWYRASGRPEDDENAPDLSTIRPGERWTLTVRLKRPHGFVNPDGFDYEGWLLERGLRATGYVRGGGDNRRVDADVRRFGTAVHRFRDAVRSRFLTTLDAAPYVGVLVALAVGDQNAIPQTQWDVFRKTGVAHLVSISGLHVSLVALLVGGAIGRLWRRIPPLALRLPARKAAAFAGLLAAAAYALLAGLGIPTQRSLVMLAVVAIAMLLGREQAGSRILALALLCVLLVDPWAVLSAGFWLSFGAVGVILYLLAGRTGRIPGWRAAAATQGGITLATAPALVVLFNGFSLLSPVANAFAIPVVSFLVTPLALLAIVVPWAPLLEFAHVLTAWMMIALEWLAALPFAMWQQAAPPALLAVAGVVGVAWVLLPRGTPARCAGVLAMLPMLAWSPPRPGDGAFTVTVLDVGNGLAVHVHTAHHDLMYDAGPAYGPEVDAGDRVLLPYLAASGIARLDALVLSHDDLDHAGGAKSLVEGVEVGKVLADLPHDHPLVGAGSPAVSACRGAPHWTWDEVGFEVLHPLPGAPKSARDNDDSCVLKITAAGRSVLLAGDIERGAERALVARSPQALASDVVVVPHHGSRSSSSAEFVRAAGAQAAVFSVGYLNPFRHPHPLVWSRWATGGARNWRTDSQGAIRIVVADGNVTVDAERLRTPRYWHGR